MQIVRKSGTVWEILEKFLWYGFVFLLPLQTVWIVREVFFVGEKWQYGTIGIYISEIFLAFWLMLSFWKKLFRSKRVHFFREKRACRKYCFGASVFFPSVFLIWIFLSSWWSLDFALSFSFGLVVFLGWGVVFGIRYFGINIRKTVSVFLCALCIQSIFGVWQFVSQDVFAIKILGISAHSAWEAGTSVLKLESGRWLRSYGGMPHPNILGGCLAAGLIFSFWEWFRARKIGRRCAFMFFFVMMLLALLCTFSRTAWMGLVFGMGILFVWLWMQEEKRNRTKEAFGTIVLVFFVFISVLFPVIFSRFDEKTVAFEGSVTDRVALAREAVFIWKEYPFFGSGLGTETLAVLQRELNSFLQNVLNKPHEPFPVWKYQPAHSVFLLILAETGVVGLFLFGGSVLLFLRKMMRVLRGKNEYAVVSACALISLFPSLFLDHWLWTTHFGILLIAFLFGIFSGNKNFAKRKFE